MKMGGLTGGIYKISLWIMRLSLANLLWILFTILGAVIFGIFPATTALFTIIKKWIKKEYDFAIFKTFWVAYRDDFKKSNIVGFILLTIGVFLYFDFKILNLYENQLLKIIQILLVGISIFYIVTVTYIFPVLVHYKASALLSIKNAFLVGMLAPLTTLSIVLSTIIIAYLSLYLPGLFVFFTVSILSMIHMLFANRELRKIDVKLTK